MKFEKFVKSLGLHGVVHERPNEEKWLTGAWETMKIPENMKGVMAKAITKMPETIEEFLHYEHTAIPCYLHRAYMPAGDSVIKDCIRIFKSEDGRFECGIRNSGYVLIEKSDVIEMYIGTDTDTFEDEPKALLIKRWVADVKEPELVGLVLRYKFEEIK